MNDPAKIMTENLSVKVKGSTCTCQKPYPPYYDSHVFLNGYKVPDFGKYSGDDNKSTYENIS